MSRNFVASLSLSLQVCAALFVAALKRWWRPNCQLQAEIWDLIVWDLTISDSGFGHLGFGIWPFRIWNLTIWDLGFDHLGFGIRPFGIWDLTMAAQLPTAGRDMRFDHEWYLDWGNKTKITGNVWKYLVTLQIVKDRSYYSLVTVQCSRVCCTSGPRCTSLSVRWRW